MRKLTAFVFALTLTFQSAFALPLHPSPTLVVNTLENIKINSDRLVVLKGPIRTIQAIKDSLLMLDNSKGPITMIINSPGGSVTDGFELVQVIESLDNPLTCIVEKEAYSMAAMIAAYCPTLYIHKFAMVMFHEASYGVQGNQTHIRKRVATNEKYLDQLAVDVAKKLGMTISEYKALIHDEFWMTADEAVSSGFANAKLLKLKYTYVEPKPSLFDILFGTFQITLEKFINRKG